MQLQDLTLPAYAQMLDALAGQLTKAKAAVPDTNAFTEARLAPDMFPLLTQVQFACFQAEELMARLYDHPLPGLPSVGSFDDATALLASTAERLRALAAHGREVEENRAVVIALPDGMTFDLTLAEYVRSWAIPQFYFHLITAYAIMRKEGVPLGKADYVPHMFQFLRKEPA